MFYSGFLPQSKHMHIGVRIIGQSKLTAVNVSVVCPLDGLEICTLSLAQCQLGLTV